MLHTSETNGHTQARHVKPLALYCALLSWRKAAMYGALIGDVIGSFWEFSGNKDPEIPLWIPACRFTDPYPGLCRLDFDHAGFPVRL